jgi:hypothetical protein
MSVWVVEHDARKLDERIRRLAHCIDSSWKSLEELIAKAKASEIHVALGFKSWPDYIADVASREMPNIARSVEQRRQVVALLAGEDMSNRAIADAVRVNEITVRRDKDAVRHDVAPADQVQVSHDDSPADQVITDPKPITGLDGKTYPAKPKRKPPKPQREPPPEYVAARKAFDEAEAALTDQERARRHKEADAFAHEIGDQIKASFSGVLVNNVIGCLEDLAADIRRLVEHGGVTSEQLRGIEAAHASYATELDVLRMSERDPGAST